MAGQVISTYDIIIEQNADWFLLVTVEDTDLTGYVATAQIREYPGASAVIEDFAASIQDEAGGIVKIALTAAETALLDFNNKSYYYDILIESGAGAISRILSGRVSLSKGVTV